jgi:hypothetical protein
MSGFERQQSPLFAKTEDFLVWLFAHTAKFPKQYRHTLTERLERSALEFQRQLGRAVLRKLPGALDEADFELWQTRQLVRLAHGLDVFPARLLQFAFGMMEVLGRLVGGCKKGTRT